MVVLLSLGDAEARAQPPVQSREVAAETVTSIERLLRMSEAEKAHWYRIKLDYLVYYYDPAWKAMWGRCGAEEAFLSLGAKIFPIVPGQRILVEGLLWPAAAGMNIEEAKVTVLAPPAPLEAMSTRGQIGDSSRFNRRMVTVEGFVDRQTVRDSNHLDLEVVADGRPVVVQLLLKNDAPIPQFKGALVRAKGVYFSRVEAGLAEPRIEVWVQSPADVEVTGSLERDERFDLAPTSLTGLAEVKPGATVCVVGALEPQEAGQPMILRDGPVRVILQTAQSAPARAGDLVEAVGVVEQDGARWILRQAVVREVQSTVTTISQLWQLPDPEQRKWHRLKLEFTVYYYDPVWKALWGGTAGRDDYLPLGDVGVAIKAGQRILVEGYITIRNGLVIDRPKVSVRAEAVPLKAVDTRGAIGDQDRFDKKFVTVEGYVDRQVVTDRQHLELDLVVEGRAVVGRVLMRGEPVPQWEGARLRLRGVYSATRDSAGGPATIELWTSGLENIEPIGSLEQDERFKRPPTPIEKLGALPLGELVQVSGVARSQQPGRSLTIRDESGQITVQTAQARLVQQGEAVQAIGWIAAEGGERILRDGLFRRTRSAPTALAAGLAALRIAGQLRELRSDEAARGYPVKLSGVVTWARPEADFFFMRDASGGVCVLRPPGATEPFWIGTKIEVTGVSAPGKFAPVVMAASVAVNSTVEMAEARPVTLEQALTGIEEAQWVSMNGFVRAVEHEGPWTRLALTTSAGEFHALMPPSDRWTGLAGSVVRLRGVCSAVANSRRQLTDIQLWVASPDSLDVEEAAPADPFTVGMRPIASLRQFSSLEGLNRRVRVAGVVIHQAPGRLVHLQEGNEALLVLSRDTVELSPGDRIEAVGFPGRENSRVVLREAVYRRSSAGPEPVPLRPGNLSPIDAELDGRLVRVEGLLLDLGTRESGVRLILQQDRLIFEAVLEAEKALVPDTWTPRSRVALTGVYEIQFDEYRRPSAVRIQLRSVHDVEVLRKAPWWTARRALGATGFLAVILLVGFGWVIALRRRVRRQTTVIREQVENEKAARLEAALARASKLESLGVLAGGIAHDFNNLLTVVIGNLSLAKLDPRIEPDTVHCLTEGERAAARAKDLTQQLLTFAKGGEPMRTSTRLPDVVRESAQFALHGAKQRCEYDIAPDLWPADVDRGQTGQVVHNIIINATQAMPAGGLVRIVMRNDDVTGPRPGLAAGRYVKMSFTDSGSGISPENLPRIFEPYFTTKRQGSGLGLATVFSIVKKHQGHVEVSSTPGVGTTFHVWLPAATHEPAPAKPAPEAKPAKTGRILFMDDEATIRLLGAAVLKRHGLKVTAVADGAAVVSEYAAAKAAGEPFDLVVLDLTVPGGMGGAEAMEQLRAIDPRVRAIVSSGYSSDPVMANYRTHGFLGRVPKPYEARDLTTAVDAVLRDA